MGGEIIKKFSRLYVGNEEISVLETAVLEIPMTRPTEFRFYL